MTSTREALLQAGVRLIAERGYPAVTVGDIEAAAGFTPRGGTLYRHFRSKRELLDAALRHHVDSLADQHGLTDLLPLPDRASELAVIGRWILRRLDAEEPISRVIEKECHRLGTLVEDMRQGVSEAGYHLFAAYLDAHRATAESTDTVAAAVLLVGALVNLRRSAWTFGHRPADVDDERALAAWIPMCLHVMNNGLSSGEHRRGAN